MTEWINALPDEVLARLRKALRGSEGIVTDAELYDGLTEEVWRRAGEDVTPGTDGAGGWPTRAVCHSNSTVFAIVRFCRDGSGPLDPGHAPVRCRPGDDGQRYYECSCGARGDEARSPTERRTQKHPSVPAICTRRQRLPGPFWWPLDGASSSEPGLRYIVCPFAETADGLDHAPSKIVDGLHWCICGCIYVLPGRDSLYRAGKVLDAV